MSDHIPDATKMVETPRTNSVKRCDQNGWIVVPVEAAYELELELAAANARVKELEEWIRSLEGVEANPSEHRRWCGYPIGWLNPGYAVFVGKEKPEGLR